MWIQTMNIAGSMWFLCQVLVAIPQVLAPALRLKVWIKVDWLKCLLWQAVGEATPGLKLLWVHQPQLYSRAATA